MPQGELQTVSRQGTAPLVERAGCGHPITSTRYCCKDCLAGERKATDRLIREIQGLYGVDTRGETIPADWFCNVRQRIGAAVRGVEAARG